MQGGRFVGLVVLPGETSLSNAASARLRRHGETQTGHGKQAPGYRTASRLRWNGADRAEEFGWSSGLKLVLGDDDRSLVEMSAWDLQIGHGRGVDHPEVPRLGHDPGRCFELSELVS